jgi:hypothetical protein
MYINLDTSSGRRWSCCQHEYQSHCPPRFDGTEHFRNSIVQVRRSREWMPLSFVTLLGSAVGGDDASGPRGIPLAHGATFDVEI